MKQFKAINTCKQLRTKTYTQRREKKANVPACSSSRTHYWYM